MILSGSWRLFAIFFSSLRFSGVSGSSRPFLAVHCGSGRFLTVLRVFVVLGSHWCVFLVILRGYWWFIEEVFLDGSWLEFKKGYFLGGIFRNSVY